MKIRSKSKRKAIRDESEESANSDSSSNKYDEDDYSMSDVNGNGGRMTRGKLQKSNGKNLRKVNLPSSDDESIDSDLLDEDESDFGRKTRNGGGRVTRGRSVSNKRKNEKEDKRGVRTRGNRI